MSVSVQSAEPVPPVSVTPDQFKIEVELDREVFLELHLTNTTSRLATFKVKTTARDRYLLRPTQDYIQPNASRVCKIVMTRMKEYPDLSNPKLLRDKFLVQSTTLDAEVPDLTRFWKDLEARHNPKANEYLYAETKVKCKLQVPAKLRAQDAAKRGLAEEAAAEAARAHQPNAAVSASHDEGILTRVSNSALADSLGSSATSFVPHAAPLPTPIEPAAPVAATTTVAAAPIQQFVPTIAPSDAASVSADALAALETEKARYAELMAFVVKTTQQLEAERQAAEAAESRVQSAIERAQAAEARAIRADQALQVAKQELARAETKAAAAAASAITDDGLRRRKAEDTAAASLVTTSAGTALDLKSPSASGGLSLQFWQIALMALVCFVLGRIFA